MLPKFPPFQGEPRATNDIDIDIVLELPLGRIGALVCALGPSFEVDVDMLRDALLHGRTCNTFFLPSVTKVDLFAVGPSPFDQIEFARRKPVERIVAMLIKLCRTLRDR